jgi:hypothetical protein
MEEEHLLLGVVEEVEVVILLLYSNVRLRRLILWKRF